MPSSSGRGSFTKPAVSTMVRHRLFLANFYLEIKSMWRNSNEFLRKHYEIKSDRKRKKKRNSEINEPYAHTNIAHAEYAIVLCDTIIICLKSRMMQPRAHEIKMLHYPIAFSKSWYSTKIRNKKSRAHASDFEIKTVHYLWLKAFLLNYRNITISPSKSNQKVQSSCLRFWNPTSSLFFF